MSNEESTAPVSAVNRKVEIPGWLALVVAAAVAWGALKNQVSTLGGQAEVSGSTAISNAATLSRLEEQILNLREGVADVREAVGSLDREQAARFKAIEDRLLAEEEARRILSTQLDRLSTRVELLVTGQIGANRSDP